MGPAWYGGCSRTSGRLHRPTFAEVHMEISVTGRHWDISSRFRSHAEHKLEKINQLAPRAQRVDVLVSHEANPRQADLSERVELTVVDKGPVVRAEASASDPYAALDLALGKLLERLRRSRSRRKDHRGHPHSQPIPIVPEQSVVAPAEPEVEVVEDENWGKSPITIREKVHAARPMSLDDALYEMELVGHPFFLFIDSDSHQPAVVYRRRGWTYGVIKLDSEVAEITV